jgi:mannose-6-phosphate isomerase
MSTTVYPLDNPIQDYAWGSRTAIAEFLGRPNLSQRPEAELWLGAHPKAPSRALAEGGPRPLDELIRSDPAGMLGPGVADRFGGELPFLLKVLAAAEPLSIQCHPDAEQARAGFERENRLGLPLAAFERNYRDPHHKPELVTALTPFSALKGFRPVPEIVRLLAPLAGPELQPRVLDLEWAGDEAALERLFAFLLSLDATTRGRVVAAAVAGAVTRGGDDPAYDWVVRLAEKHPGDVGVLSPVLLNLLVLEPEEAVYVSAGELHAHLEGTALEIMANSDNVLRGGLTPKHVDVAELLRIARFRAGPPERIRPEPVSDRERVYRTPAVEFELGLVDVEPGRACESLPGRGVELLLGLEGDASLVAEGRSVSVAKGRSAFVPAAVARYRVLGKGRVCRAGVPGRNP